MRKIMKNSFKCSRKNVRKKNNFLNDEKSGFFKKLLVYLMLKTMLSDEETIKYVVLIIDQNVIELRLYCFDR